MLTLPIGPSPLDQRQLIDQVSSGALAPGGVDADPAEVLRRPKRHLRQALTLDRFLDLFEQQSSANLATTTRALPGNHSGIHVPAR